MPTIERSKFDPRPMSVSQAIEIKQTRIARGSQGTIFSCRSDYDGVVLKLYKRPRAHGDLKRVQNLIRLAEVLDPSSFAERIMLERLNLPLKPVVTEKGELGGVFVPELPEECTTSEVEYDKAAQRLVPNGGRLQYQIQYLTRGPLTKIGSVSEAWRWRIGFSLVETVVCMHSANLIHADLSAANVLGQAKGRTHLDDEVYLIDLDDAFAVGGEEVIPQVRVSGKLFDPYSRAAGTLTKATDVFVVALWLVGLVRRRLDMPTPGFADLLPAEVFTSLRTLSPGLDVVVRRALGPIGVRPHIEDLYGPVHVAARKVGALT